VLQCELEAKLGCEKHERRTEDMPVNYRNGSTKRKLKTQIGEVEIAVTRDRNGEYEPKIIEKYQRNADGLEEKILFTPMVCQHAIYRNKLKTSIISTPL